MLARHPRDDLGAARARLSGQREVERAPGQRLVLGPAQHLEIGLPLDRARGRAGKPGEAIPFRGGGVARDDPQPGGLERTVERLRIAFQRGETPACFGGDGGFAHVAERADQVGAQVGIDQRFAGSHVEA